MRAPLAPRLFRLLIAVTALIALMDPLSDALSDPDPDDWIPQIDSRLARYETTGDRIVYAIMLPQATEACVERTRTAFARPADQRCPKAVALDPDPPPVRPTAI